MNWINPVSLSGARVRLEPLSDHHHDDLADATRDGQLWNLWYTSVPSPDEMASEIERRLGLLEQQLMLPFSVVSLSTGKAVGMTTFMNIDAANRHVEIGSTWYRRSVQRSGLNTECKLLLMTHAFETLDCIAVEFRTHIMNRKSRAAIERLGAKLDGILRNHQIMASGTLRDTCVYSVIQSEWPTIKQNLEFRLQQPEGGR